MNQRVLVASNRGPVSYQFGTDGSLTGHRGGGGMIAGVTEGLAALGPEADVTWICTALSDADRAAAAQQDAAARAEGARAGALRAGHGIGVRMLDIPPDIFDRAYNHVANSALWFVHHLLFDTPNQPQFGHEFRRDWESYVVYNEAFAGALTREALSRTPSRKTLSQKALSPGAERERGGGGGKRGVV
jgi:trehalose 6-phosphate synthase